MTDTTSAIVPTPEAHAHVEADAPATPPARRRRSLTDRLRDTGGRIASAVLSAHGAGVPF
ncbi:hypothetical protein [Streptosporangium sp. NPDC006007]|uniref:hypothetical protein n=1 Tax=Streptosporangium sp. NPDC006007 TaxID=3154575 RepID=UPI0033AA2929